VVDSEGRLKQWCQTQKLNWAKKKKGLTLGGPQKKSMFIET
jgi:hypothetical protein